MKFKLNPKLIVFLGTLGISTSPILIKSSNSPALTIAFYRMAITVMILLPYVFLKYKKEILNLEFKQIRNTALSGLFLGLHFTTWILSLKYTAVASATILVNTTPILLLIISYILLNEKANKKQIFAIIFAFIGSIIISIGDFSAGSNAIRGDIYALLGALFFGFYLLLGTNVRKKVAMVPYTFLTYSFAAVTILILNLFIHDSMIIVEKRELILFISMAIFPTLLGHSLFNYSLKYVKATFVSMVALLEPIISTILAIFIFSELPRFTQIIGATIVLLSIYNYTKIKKSSS